MRMISVFMALLLAPLGAVAQDGSQFFKGSGAYTLAPRYALVIGVSSVNDASLFQSLPNPANDAREISKALRKLDFTVIAPHENYGPRQITRQTIKQSLYDFAMLIKEIRGAVGLVYFSGHGIELHGHSYLVPYDGYVRFNRDLKEELVPITWFYDAFRHAGNNLNLLFIDACRNFPDEWGKLPSFGLPFKTDSSIPDAANVIRFDATLSGVTASDGKENELSPFAAAFLDSLRQPDASLPRFFANISERVKKHSPQKQSPKIGSSGQNFIFFPTEKSYNDEYFLYSIASLSGNRTLLERTSTQFANGYFTRFVEDQLKNTPVTPTRPTRFVRLIKATALRELPRANSQVITTAAAGERMGIYESLVHNDFKAWLPLYGPHGDPVWIDRGAAAMIALVPVSHPMQFEIRAGSSMETLTQAARETVRAATKNKGVIKQIEVRALAYSPESASESPPVHRVMARQALVVQALEEAGYKSADVQITKVELTQDPAKGATVTLIVTAENAGS